MKQSLKSTIVMLALVPAWFLVGCGTPEKTPEDVRGTEVKNATDTPSGIASTTSVLPIPNKFVDPARFAASNAMAPWTHTGKPVAGVVNHHVLGSDLLAGFFKTLKQDQPEIRTFIILSPDHFAVGEDISTSALDYATPQGLLANRQKQAKKCEINGIVSGLYVGYATRTADLICVWDGTDKRAFENEHGVGALAPFIKREFPDSKIVPIFLSRTASADRLRKLGQALKSFGPGTFVIVSSDMSHYLRLEQSQERDRQTLRWLGKGEWKPLENATDKNTDSASGFTVLRKYLSDSKTVFKLLKNSTAYDYSHDELNVTTYIVGFWETF